VARTLADAQRSLGHHVRVIAVRADRFKEEADAVLPDSGPIGWNRAMRHLDVEWEALDAVHIHAGIWRSQLYYYALRRRSPKAAWVIHLHGSETRSGKGLHHLGLADAVLCSTPDLRRLVPSAEWLPNPVRLPDPVPPRPRDGPVVFGHFPSDRRVKGTAAILDSMRRAIRKEGAVSEVRTGVRRWTWGHADLVVGEGLPHETVLDLMRACDAIVDHLSSLGPVGLVSLEAMSLGRAAISSYDVEMYPKVCPVIHFSHADASDVFRRVLEHPDELERGGSLGRRYVQELHDAQRVAARTVGIYEEAQRSRLR